MLKASNPKEKAIIASFMRPIQKSVELLCRDPRTIITPSQPTPTRTLYRDDVEYDDRQVKLDIFVGKEQNPPPSREDGRFPFSRIIIEDEFPDTKMPALAICQFGDGNMDIAYGMSIEALRCTAFGLGEITFRKYPEMPLEPNDEGKTFGLKQLDHLVGVVEVALLQI